MDVTICVSLVLLSSLGTLTLVGFIGDYLQLFEGSRRYEAYLLFGGLLGFLCWIWCELYFIHFIPTNDLVSFIPTNDPICYLLFNGSV